MVHDLYILMITAGVVSLLFKLLKQPVVLGYIVAGILVGPHLFGEKLVDMENVETWGNIGVLFVLFCIGLEFRMKNLFESGKVALIGAATIVVGMMLLGFGVGKFAELDTMNSLFLAAMLCPILFYFGQWWILVPPFVVGVIFQWTIAVGLSYVIGIPLGYGLVGMWIGFALDENVRGVILVRRWRSGKWKSKGFVKEGSF